MILYIIFTIFITFITFTTLFFFILWRSPNLTYIFYPITTYTDIMNGRSIVNLFVYI